MGQGEYRQRPSWGTSVLWMLTGGTLAATALLGASQLPFLGDRLLSGLNTLLNPAQPKPKVDVRSLVLQQIRESSELTTASFTMQAVVPTEQEASFGGIAIGKTKLLYIAHGEVQAGVDLSQLMAANVQTTGDGVRIQLPAAKILSQSIDVNRSQVYDYNRGALGLGPDVGPELQALAQQEALKKIVAAACAEGLLKRASDRAQRVVTQLLNTAGYKAVTVEAAPLELKDCSTPATPAISPNSIAPEPAMPASPSPLPPGNSLNPTSMPVVPRQGPGLASPPPGG